MTKRVEFHQAQIQGAFRIVDDEKSYGLQPFTLTVLVDTEAEWATVRESIEKARQQLQEQLAQEGDNANSD